MILLTHFIQFTHRLAYLLAVCIYLCVCVFACVRMDACIQSCGQAVNHHTLTIMHIHKICAFAYACHDANKKCFH